MIVKFSLSNLWVGNKIVPSQCKLLALFIAFEVKKVCPELSVYTRLCKNVPPGARYFVFCLLKGCSIG